MMDISIHALLAESDQVRKVWLGGWAISIHALLAESDINEIPYQRKINEFLSTLSLRRATHKPVYHQGPGWYFYPRSPCGERLIA